MTTNNAEATPTWMPQTPEQELEMAQLLESLMFAAVGIYAHQRWHDGLERHMTGRAEGFVIPLSDAALPE
ncbi:hypothetical protein [Acidovorax sp. SUPP2539]|uniref:hypothetical protein n=1 Tax=Acidovorax sp. SUPP2539 TaxID=2920878 RepID=UPI0023DE4988|nr:hypothetical protein [Acidovorax sp. SUPP2539]GKS91210.1 hypothetical protein AVTE2539_17615 [Acidovorax sp. SUPP2539]